MPCFKRTWLAEGLGRPGGRAPVWGVRFGFAWDPALTNQPTPKDIESVISEQRMRKHAEGWESDMVDFLKLSPQRFVREDSTSGNRIWWSIGNYFEQVKNNFNYTQPINKCFQSVAPEILEERT